MTKKYSKKQRREVLKKIRKVEYNILVIKKKIKKSNNFIIAKENIIKKIYTYKKEDQSSYWLGFYNNEILSVALQVKILNEKLKQELDSLTILNTQLTFFCFFKSLKKFNKNVALNLKKQEVKKKRKEQKKKIKVEYTKNLEKKKLKKEENLRKEEDKRNKLLMKRWNAEESKKFKAVSSAWKTNKKDSDKMFLEDRALKEVFEEMLINEYKLKK